MKYSEYNKFSEYKIKIGKRKYFFRDAVKYYLNKYNLNTGDIIAEDHQYHKSNKIIEQIVSVIKDSDLEIDNNNKIIFNNHIIIQLAKKDYLVKNSRLTFDIIEYLKKIKVISKKSKAFTKVYKQQDVNRLTSCFTNIDFSVYEKILNLRDESLNIILNSSNEDERELHLFYYLNLFSMKKYQDYIYDNFSRSKLFNLDETIVLILEKKYSNEYSTVKVVYFDIKLNNVLHDVFFNESDNLFDKTDHYFKKENEFYKHKLTLFLKGKYEDTTGFSLDNYNKKTFKRMIRNQIEAEYQFYHTPFEHTLYISTLYPHTNYLELIKIFPDIETNKHLESIELNNLRLQKKQTVLDKDDIDEMDIITYMNINTDAYIEFREFRRFKNIKTKRDYEAYVNRLDKFIAKHKDTFAFPNMFYYVMSYVSNSRFSNDGSLASSTIYGVLSILFNSCFQFIIKEGKLDETVVELIETNVNLYDKSDTKNKYERIINPFLNLFGFNIGVDKKNAAIYARKSLIFKIELNELFKVLVEEDSFKYDLDLTTKESRFITYQRFIFCMLMYYSGLRESELWSRTIKDVYIFDDNITIDINSNSLIKKFKTQSAKRRVEFIIDDHTYFNIFKEYLALAEVEKIKYLFPLVSNNKILKKDVQNIEYFLTCNKIIQSITKRYTSLHSFRHTYVTNNIRKLIIKNKKQKKDIYNLINMIGHLGPDVSLRFYAHIDYVLNYQNKNIF